MEKTGTYELAKELVDMRDQGLAEARQGPHSLRTVATLDEVEYIDDSSSTFLDAALLSIIDLGKPLVWIAGAPMVAAMEDRLKAFMAQHVDAIVFYGKAAADQVDALDAELGQVYNADCLRTAVFAARELAQPGTRVLFSPACPSTDEAANHAERAAEFIRAVEDL
ncbi:MAG TPA: hypothetical protein PKD45_06265 [Flavobacteriales bacterium]|nr:hypothetical protein [Flavobacteriales bacterium]